MTKKEISCILARASREEVLKIAGMLNKTHDIRIIKKPQKTLVMVQVKETIKQCLFYLGEVLASECMVAVDGVKGCNVMAGDDFKKVQAAAIIDAAFNKKVFECMGMETEIKALGTKQEEERGRLNAQILKSKVNFDVMGE